MSASAIVHHLRQTHTFVNLEVSASTYREIYEKLKEAGYEHTFIQDRGIITIDMTGIGIIPPAAPENEPGQGR